MTSDNPDSGAPEGRSQAGRGARRVDQGDLWNTDDAPAVARPARRPPRRRPAPDAAPFGDESERAAPAVATQPPLAREEPREAYARPAAPPPPAYDDDDDYYDEEPSVLSNPYLLAAIAVAGAIVLAVIVVFLFGGDDNGPSTGVTANPTRTPTRQGGATGPNATGVAARSIAISTVREGPALGQLELGTLPADQDVDVVGRNEDSSWFQIVFPPGSGLRGWVPNSALRLPDNVDALVAVVEATPVPRPEVPDPTPTVPVEPEQSPTPGDPEGPDLAVSIASDCTVGTEIVIAISNLGTEALENELIEVIVSHNSIVEYQQPFQAQVPVDGGAQLNTGVRARAPRMEVVVRLQEVDDIDPSNNGASCEVQAAAPNNGAGNLPPAVATQVAGQ